MNIQFSARTISLTLLLQVVVLGMAGVFVAGCASRAKQEQISAEVQQSSRRVLIAMIYGAIDERKETFLQVIEVFNRAGIQGSAGGLQVLEVFVKETDFEKSKSFLSNAAELKGRNISVVPPASGGLEEIQKDPELVIFRRMAIGYSRPIKRSRLIYLDVAEDRFKIVKDSLSGVPDISIQMGAGLTASGIGEENVIVKVRADEVGIPMKMGARTVAYGRYLSQGAVVVLRFVLRCNGEAWEIESEETFMVS